MGELVPAQPIIRLNSTVSLPVDFISTLSLLYRAVPGAGLDPWLVNARRTLPDETRYDLDILEGFSGRLLYYLEEPVTRFNPLVAGNLDATFIDLLDFMTDLSPRDYLDMAVRAVQRVREDERLDTEWPDPNQGDGQNELAWRRFLAPSLTTATVDEVIPLFQDPAQLRHRTLNLFRSVWQTVYRDEYLRQFETLNMAAEQASLILHRGFGRVFGDLTDARLPSTLAVRLHDISEITFHPSVHLGSYLSYILSPPRGIIFFNAQRFMQRQRDSARLAEPAVLPADRATLTAADPGPGPLAGPIGGGPDRRSIFLDPADDSAPAADPMEELDADAVVECARALGDSTRLRILEMLADGEHYAQEIVSRMGIAQSAVSRHLSLLERSGLVSVRPQRGMKYYSVSEANVRRFAHSITARLRSPGR
jgi:DNA-binding transcriptional ArsR family regulator